MRFRVPVIFGSVAFLWGIPYALIKVALDHGAGPLLIAWTRVAIGAAVLLAVAAARGELRGLRRHARAVGSASTTRFSRWWFAESPESAGRSLPGSP